MIISRKRDRVDLSGPEGIAHRSHRGMAFIDGRFCPIEEAKISVLDWGLLKADATFDVVTTWKGAFFRLEDHLDRFERSLKRVRLITPFAREELTEILHQCVARSGLRDAFVYMVCTRGVPPEGSRDLRSCQNSFFAFAKPFEWILPLEEQQQGCRILVSSVQRIAPEAVDPIAKNFHRGDFSRGLFQAFDHGKKLAVLVDREGNLTEGPGFNVFSINEGRVRTPNRGVLEGITRQTALELCKDLQIHATEGPVTSQDFRESDEAFLTSSAGGIIPIVEIDDRLIGQGIPGPITTRLRELYWSRRESGWKSTPINYQNAGDMAVQD